MSLHILRCCGIQFRSILRVAVRKLAVYTYQAIRIFFLNYGEVDEAISAFVICTSTVPLQCT